jgi:hypothetical protein
MIRLNGISLDYSLACSVICIDDSCVCMVARAFQRAVYRWWGAHAHYLPCFLGIMSFNLLGVER